MLTDLDRNGIKAKVGLAVKLAGGQENAANVTTRIARHATFSEYGNARLVDRHVPIDVAIEIDQFNGRPMIIAHAAALLGFKLVSLPSARIAGSEMGALVRLIKEAGEALTAISDRMSVGAQAHTVTDQAVLKELDEMIEAALEVRERLSPMPEQEIGE